MNGRRSFVKGIGLLSAIFAGGAYAGTQNAGPLLAGPNLHDADSNDVGQTIDHLAPPIDATHSVLTITGRYGEKKQQETVCNDLNGNQFYFAPNHGEITNTVHLTVGRDNRLWIKINDEWKRVALEG